MQEKTKKGKAVGAKMSMASKAKKHAGTFAKGAVLGLFAGVVAMGLKYVSPSIPYAGKYINEYL